MSQSVVLFVCLHGSAKSLIAATHLSRLASERGLDWRGESAGVEPDAEVPAGVVAGLAGDGIDVRGYRPAQVTASKLAAAARVVSFGCDLSSIASEWAPVQQWDDMPLVSDGYGRAREAIVSRVAQLLDDLEQG